MVLRWDSRLKQGLLSGLRGIERVEPVIRFFSRDGPDGRFMGQLLIRFDDSLEGYRQAGEAVTARANIR